MKKWEKFTDEQLEQLVKDSKSVRELAEKIGYNLDSGSGATSVKNMLELKHFDTSHFLSQNWNKNNFDYSRFQEGKYIKSSSALNALIFLRGRKCECCLQEKWNNQLIPLEIHHIDGNHLNNKLDNLQILCCNCHALTNNFKGRNQQSTSKNNPKVDDEELVQALKNTPNVRQALLKVGLTSRGHNYDRAYDLLNKYNIIQKEELPIKNIKQTRFQNINDICKKCGRPLSTKDAEYCQTCIHEFQRKCEWPSRDELKKLIRSTPFLQIGKKYNVSDNAVRKWCLNYGLPSKKMEIKAISDEDWINI